MINDKTFSHLHVILGNMCRYVKAYYWEINFDSKEWFQDYTWNKEKEKHFKKVVNLLYLRGKRCPKRTL